MIMADDSYVVYCDDYEAIVGPKPKPQVKAKVVQASEPDQPEVNSEVETKEA